MSLPSDNPVLDARGLVFPADGAVLNQAGLAVGEGETVAVLGAPGAGKTTLMSCLSGEAAAAHGVVWTNGKPLHLFSPDQRHAFRLRHYGLVHQDVIFVPELTLVQSTALPLRFAGMGEREAEARARTWLSRFEIEDAADLRPADLLSGVVSADAEARVGTWLSRREIEDAAGWRAVELASSPAPSDAASPESALGSMLSAMPSGVAPTDAASTKGATARMLSSSALSVETLRRAALARAMVNDPLVLFADEPFIGLSEESVFTITRILHSIARSHGTAVILFTSDAATAERCERIVHLVAGRTTAEPTPAPALVPVRPADFSIAAADGASSSPARVWR